MTDPDDAELYARWGAGDTTAGAALFDRFFLALARFFRSKVGQGTGLDVQDDLIQATFTTALEVRERYRAEGSFRSFLFGIAYNVLRRHHELQHRDARVDFSTLSVHDLAPGPATVVGDAARAELVQTGMRRLPVELQVALELFYWESMTAIEIGEVLEVPEGTVKSRLRRARTLLEIALAELGAPEHAAGALVEGSRREFDD